MAAGRNGQIRRVMPSAPPPLARPELAFPIGSRAAGDAAISWSLHARPWRMRAEFAGDGKRHPPPTTWAGERFEQEHCHRSTQPARRGDGRAMGAGPPTATRKSPRPAAGGMIHRMPSPQLVWAFVKRPQPRTQFPHRPWAADRCGSSLSRPPAAPDVGQQAPRHPDSDTPRPSVAGGIGKQMAR